MKYLSDHGVLGNTSDRVYASAVSEVRYISAHILIMPLPAMSKVGAHKSR